MYTAYKLSDRNNDFLVKDVSFLWNSKTQDKKSPLITTPKFLHLIVWISMIILKTISLNMDIFSEKGN